MESKSLKTYIVEFLLIIFLLLACLYNNVLTRPVIAVVLLVSMMIILSVLKTNKLKSTRSKQIVILMSVFGVMFVVIKYMLGIYFGFYNASVTLSIWSVVNYIIPYIVIIVSSEVIRKRIILSTSEKEIFSKFLFLVLMVILDVSLFSNIHDLDSLKKWFDLVALIIFPSIASNLLYIFISKNFREENGIIIYRCLTTLYIYLIPIIPNIEVLLEAIFNLVMPCIIYFVLNKYLKKNQEFSIKNDKIEKFLTIVSGIIVLVIIMLVSCKFRYGALVIGSGSMTGTINKGDVIVYEDISVAKKYGNQIKIQKGDIIVFIKNDKRIVHRVIDKRIVRGKEVYYTKGDANQEQDDGFVSDEAVVGICRLTVPYIGNITLSINKAFD